jgi:hypothetical protein
LSGGGFSKNRILAALADQRRGAPPEPVAALKIPCLAHKPATAEPKCRLIAKRF